MASISKIITKKGDLTAYRVDYNDIKIHSELSKKKCKFFYIRNYASMTEALLSAFQFKHEIESAARQAKRDIKLYKKIPNSGVTRWANNRIKLNIGGLNIGVYESKKQQKFVIRLTKTSGQKRTYVTTLDKFDYVHWFIPKIHVLLSLLACDRNIKSLPQPWIDAIPSKEEMTKFLSQFSKETATLEPIKNEESHDREE